MLDTLISAPQYIIPFLVILSVVVFVHEFGHYWVARRNGVRVETFSIGFGPELFGRNDAHGTRWKVSAVPLGGYVKMLGDSDATSSRVDVERAKDPDSFPAKSVWQRMAVVVAGPLANFLYAIVVLAILFATVGRPVTPAEIGQIVADGAAASAGLQVGDRVTAIDGKPIASFEDLQAIVRESAGVQLTFTIDRSGESLDVPVVPALKEVKERFGGTHNVGQIGVARAGVEFKRSNAFLALFEATGETWRMITGTLSALGEMIVGERGTEELGGPIRIAQMSGEIAREGVVAVIWFTAVLSINLGLINLFPIPMLDGGHLMMYGIEAARGRPLNERSQEIAFRFGLAMVLSLMVFATWNDIVHVIWSKFVS